MTCSVAIVPETCTGHSRNAFLKSRRLSDDNAQPFKAQYGVLNELSQSAGEPTIYSSMTPRGCNARNRDVFCSVSPLHGGNCMLTADTAHGKRMVRGYLSNHPCTSTQPLALYRPYDVVASQNFLKRHRATVSPWCNR